AARADQRGDRHLDGAHPGDHGVRHRDARGDQSPGRCRAGNDPDGRGRDRRPVRRARRAEDPQRAIAAAARPAGAGGRASLRVRIGAAAGGALHGAPGRGARMSRGSAIAAALATLALLWAPGPASAERLVTSLSNYRVSIGSNFTGADLVLFGTVDQITTRRGGYDLVVTVIGPRQTVDTWRKERIFGIWVNAESRTFVDAPSYLAVLANRPVDAIAA